MIRFLLLALLIGAPSVAEAGCGQTANYAGCSGQNGAGVYNKNSGAVHGGQYNTYHRPAPGTSASGWRGNSATKGVGTCNWVNGQRYCH
jgi:hypothetical protein